MDKGISESYKKAGEIAVKARDFAKTLLKEGALYLEIADKVEQKIFELDGKPAFPVNISVNEIAAHHVPTFDEKLILKLGDLVKIDIGVHVEGFVADTAFSFSIGKSEENEELIKAAEKALDSALKLAKPNVKVCEIGSAIEKEILGFDARPIRNLTGHMVDEFELHAGQNIPNFDNKDETELEEAQVFAIEPFATFGEGFVTEGKPAEVFLLEARGAVRNKEILAFIEEEYVTLPFAKRWLVKKFGAMKTNLALKEAISKGLIHQYNELKEKSGKKVSQAEHTVIVQKNPEIITK